MGRSHSKTTALDSGKPRAKGKVKSQRATTIPHIRAPIIVTVGDISFDWLWFREAPSKVQVDGSERTDLISRGNDQERQPQAWRSRPQAQAVALHGGAWYIDNFIRVLLGPHDNHNVFTYRRLPSYRLRAGDSRVVLHSTTDYDLKVLDARKPSDQTVYRVVTEPMYFGPKESEGRKHPKLIGCKLQDLVREQLKVLTALRDLSASPKARVATDKSDHEPPSYVAENFEIKEPYPNEIEQQLVVIHDQGNGFCEVEDHWNVNLPASDSSKRVNPIKAVVLVLDSRVEHWRQGHPLRDYLEKHLYLDRTVVVASAGALRRAGVLISKSVSWEQTAYDFRSQLSEHPVLKELVKAGHLVVRFGISGLIHYMKSKNSCFLYYDPKHVEGEYRQPDVEGKMFGYNAILAATIAAGYRSRLRRKLDEVDLSEEEQERFLSGVPTSHDDFYSRVLQDSVTHNLKEGLANCRSYYRHGFGSDIRLLRGRLEEWDTLAEWHNLARTIRGKKIRLDEDNSPLRRFEVGVYHESELVEDAVLADLKERGTRSLKFQLDVREDPIGGTLLYPDKVIRELASSLCEALNKKSPNGLRSLRAEPKHLDNRKGKALVMVQIAPNGDPTRRAWKDVITELESDYLPDPEPDEFREKRQQFLENASSLACNKIKEWLKRQCNYDDSGWKELSNLLQRWEKLEEFIRERGFDSLPPEFADLLLQINPPKARGGMQSKQGKGTAVVRPEDAQQVIHDLMVDDAETWACRLVRERVLHVYHRLVVDHDWRFVWPICIRSYRKDIEDFARVRVKEKVEENWVILEPGASGLEIMALDIVQHGVEDALSKLTEGGKSISAAGDDLPDSDGRFPCVSFGDLTTVDRKEIESYRSIRILMQQYLAKSGEDREATSTPVRPLSFAVFGPP